MTVTYDILTSADRADLDGLDHVELFAVYGTLRTGCGNDRIWRGRAESVGTDTIRPYRMVSNGAFPYVMYAPKFGTAVTVELVRPLPVHADAVLQDMDGLEGVPHHYVRTIVITEEGTTAWLYVPSARTAERAANLTAIPSGDWLDRPPRHGSDS